MDIRIEQQLPNKPNFPLIVAMSLVTIVVALGIGYVILHHQAGHVLPDGKSKQSSLVVAHSPAGLTKA